MPILVVASERLATMTDIRSRCECAKRTVQSFIVVENLFLFYWFVICSRCHSVHTQMRIENAIKGEFIEMQSISTRLWRRPAKQSRAQACVMQKFIFIHRSRWKVQMCSCITLTPTLQLHRTHISIGIHGKPFGGIFTIESVRRARNEENLCSLLVRNTAACLEVMLMHLNVIGKWWKQVRRWQSAVPEAEMEDVMSKLK